MRSQKQGGYITLKPFNKNVSDSPNIGPWGHTIRPNGGEWDLLGAESYHGDMPGFVGLSGCVSNPDEKDLPEIWFHRCRFKYGGLEDCTPPFLSYADGQAMVTIAEGKSENIDKSILNRLGNYGYIKKTNDGFIPTIMVMRRNKSRQMPQYIREQFEALRHKSVEIATRHYLFYHNGFFNVFRRFLVF